MLAVAQRLHVPMCQMRVDVACMYLSTVLHLLAHLSFHSCGVGGSFAAEHAHHVAQFHLGLGRLQQPLPDQILQAKLITSLKDVLKFAIMQTNGALESVDDSFCEVLRDCSVSGLGLPGGVRGREENGVGCGGQRWYHTGSKR